MYLNLFIPDYAVEIAPETIKVQINLTTVQMARTQQLSHNGMAIFYMDFSNLNNVKDINGVITESVNYIRHKPVASLYCLTNISGMHFSNEIKELFQNFVKGNKPYVKASAVVGLNGLQQILYNGLMKITGRDIKSFNSIDQAKEWLAGMNKN